MTDVALYDASYFLHLICQYELPCDGVTHALVI